MIGEDAVNHTPAHLQIPNPPPAGALHRVPNIVLHAQMHGVSARLPDAIQQGIGRFKRSFVFNRIINAVELNRFEMDLWSAADKANLRISKSGLWTVRGRVARDSQEIRSHEVAA